MTPRTPALASGATPSVAGPTTLPPSCLATKPASSTSRTTSWRRPQRHADVRSSGSRSADPDPAHGPTARLRSTVRPVLAGVASASPGRLHGHHEAPAHRRGASSLAVDAGAAPGGVEACRGPRAAAVAAAAGQAGDRRRLRRGRGPLAACRQVVARRRWCRRQPRLHRRTCPGARWLCPSTSRPSCLRRNRRSSGCCRLHLRALNTAQPAASHQSACADP